ncbi:lipase family protein [Streptomyces sp. SID13031]|uniref:lipase family protein n=1 Tax=Streptomyces sp. SID13031 TaxID=2706046 RepID=UPI0013CD3097|nr:lipase family protein [Streptomyces sp. SID13031]NEA31354.1 prolyl oligopeptidase family serine peptidase [Streptomyces sp. SID13031]
MKSGRRLARIAGAVLLAAVLVTGLASTADADGYRPPGKVVKIEQLPESLRLPGAAKAQRLYYTSTGFDGRPTVVSGALFVPPGKAPKGGWPVLSWAHGTVGIADNCANSVNGRSQRDVDYLTSWIAAGYAIVASDYEGLGTPGTHPYVNGKSEAYGLIDIVRAGRQADKSLGRRWVASGQSQGAQAVLFAGALQDRYAPELDYRGTISTAPISQWRMTFAAVHPFTADTPANPFVILLLAGTKASHPHSFAPGRYLTDFGKDLYQKAITTECYTAIAQLAAGKKSQDLYDVDTPEAERLLSLLVADAEIPVEHHAEPIFLAQGTADTVVYAPATTTTADKLRAAGNNLTYNIYPGIDHNGLMGAAKAEILAWTAARFQHD